MDLAEVGGSEPPTRGGEGLGGEAAANVVCPSTLLPALDFREEEALWERALGSPAWRCHLTSPLWDLAHLPMSMSLPGWGCITLIT